TINGGNGNDTVDGGLGADSLNGGDGNDTYFVDNLGDIVAETFNDALGGVDSVSASVSHTLGFGIENLTLTGFGNINGTGNGNNNVITGNSGNNILDGGAGNDTINGGNGNDTVDGGLGADSLNGGDGNDTYFVDNLGDIVAETFNDALGGVDSVSASVSHTLGFGIENLTLTGFGNINGTGNGNNNVITGNSGSNFLSGDAGNDTINGGSGDDTITGGAGADLLTGGFGVNTFVYNNLSEGGDTITDFIFLDRIQLRFSGFSGLNLGTLTSNRYGEGFSLSSAANAARNAGAFGAAVLGVSSGSNVQVWYTGNTFNTAFLNTGATLLATLTGTSLGSISQSNFSVIV
ncbi:calcium-binding protein, partial [Pannus brasiliensis CCIBt3594]